MTETAEQTPPEAPPVVPDQRGRYALYSQPDGPVIAYTTSLCETCAACGCGDQAAEPLDLTATGRMKMLQMAIANGISVPGFVRKMISRGIPS